MAMCKVPERYPLVSIGMPVYNRPDGLRRSLTCLTNQTYKNIEIIVSDNCSPGEDVKNVIGEFMQHDNRITYCRQEVSLGVDGNFKFVLEKATGEFFMWAADDDEWSEEFIEQCLKVLLQVDVVSVMSHFKTSYRFEGREEIARVPPLSIDKSKAQNALTFLGCITPTLFYGLHKRSEIDFFLHDDFYEFYDCYFVLKLILTGRVAVVEPCLYTAGVDAPTYQIKASNKYRFTQLRYSPLLFNSIKQVFLSTMKVHEKLSVIFKLIYVVMSLFWSHEIKRMFR